jgi:CRISPR-associated protein Csd1
MILQSLRALAEREGLVDDPAFESKPVRWIVHLKRSGKFIGAYNTNQTPLAAEGKKGTPRPEAKMMLIPRRRGRTVNIAADFLVDKAEYALGLALPGTLPDAKTPKRLADFVELLQEAQAATGSELIPAVSSFLADAGARSACEASLAEQGGFATNDLFAFEVDGDDLHAEDDLRAWWAERSSATDDAAERSHQCLLCGRFGAVVEKHNMIQIRGGSTSGIPLVSFNSDAFEKYGLSRNENAPVCNKCMTAYVEGLRRLTRPRYKMPRSGLTVGPLSTPLNDDTTAVYWADADSELVSTLPRLRDDPKVVQELLLSPHKGSRFWAGDANRFYCLILGGAQGRAIVRKIHTGTVAEVAKNLVRYFAAIDVERFNRAEPLPLYRLQKSLVLKGEIDRLPPGLATEIWMAGLFGQALSRSLLTALIARNCAERAVPAERAALLHLYFAVKYPNEFKEREAHPMSLDPENKDAPYLLGRLLAVLERLQTAAQGDGLNRTIVDRFYGAASTRPGVIFPQLIKLSKHHLAKAGKKVEGRANYLDRELGAIVDGLDAGGFSGTLTLEQQGKFAIGYYHQRQSFYKKKAGDTDSADTIHETTNEATNERPNEKNGEAQA